MLKIIVKEGENIDRALKRYKRKYKNVKQMQELRERKHFSKKSILRREQIKKAEYREKFLRQQND